MADRVNFDYYITYPSLQAPISSNQERESGDGKGGNSQRDDFVFIHKEEERPVVVLLGWAGCQDKYLAKYSAIYEEKSCITVRCTAPVECLFWHCEKMPEIGRQLLQVLCDQSLNQHPIFFHIFSNGGAILYQQISLAIEQSKSPINVKGVIFDSSPGKRRVSALFRAISAIVGGNPIINFPMSLAITFFLCGLWIYEILIQPWSRAVPVQTNPLALTEEAHSWPQLFVYSNADTLIPAMDVEKFASRRAERGVRVQLVQFTDSPHVKHYAVYPDVYVNTVCTFIHQCLGDNGDGFNFHGSMDDEDGIELEFHDTVSGLTKRIVMPQEAAICPSKQLNEQS